MPRPALTHDGFLIPNAGDVTNPRMAEPDRIDFNTMAHARWGVIEGCLVTVSGSMAMTNGGLALVDGMLVTVSSASLPVPSGGAQDRFDLIVVDQAGTLKLVSGSSAVDPVFPDPPLNVTVLAAVFAAAGASVSSDNIIDKRKFVQKALLTKIDPASLLIQNRNGSGDAYSVTGDGKHTWTADTSLWRTAIGTLRVQAKLTVDDTIIAGGALTANSLTATNLVAGSNLRNGSALPGSNDITGAIFQNTADGRVYAWQNAAWKELATVDGTVPVGTIIQSVEVDSVMIPKGWLPLDGRTISETQYPRLFTLAALGSFVTGTAPNRSMVLPNATDRVLIQKATGAGTVGGSNTRNLTLAQMPQHNHNVAVAPNTEYGQTSTVNTSRAGTHGHQVTGGAHGHPVSDPGHAHNGFDRGDGGEPIVTSWGGRNKIDAFFNDRNHTYSVEKATWTRTSYSNISVGSAGSDHGHNVIENGDHQHVVYVVPPPPHVHSVSQENRGSGEAVDITPAYLAIYTYVRT